MYLSARRLSILVLVSLAFFAKTACAQSLSIIKEGETAFWLEATAPQDARYVLEVSKDLNEWLVVNDAACGTVSNRLAVSGLAERYFRLIPWVEPAQIRIALLGDSTVADLTVNEGFYNGWGQGMYAYFRPEAQVINLASPGLGTKNFLTSEQKACMLAIKPDFVLVDLFYVDAFNGPPEVTTTLEEFETNMKSIIQMIRDFNGTPILLTPQGLWIWNDQGKTGPAYADRIAIVKKLAAEEHLYLIDLSTSSNDLFNQLGKDGSQPLFVDWLHFSSKGAEIVAGLVVNALPSNFGPYLVTEKVLTF